MRLQEQISIEFNLAQFDSIVKLGLDESREQFSTKTTGFPEIIFEVLDAMERQGKLLRFLLFLQRLARPVLTAAVEDYLGEISGAPIVKTDPYKAIVVFNLPFVDRQILKEKLRDFFKSSPMGVMVTKGTRFTGRTHPRYFIQHVTNQEGFGHVYLDLLEYTELSDFIADIANQMKLDVKSFRDRVAQFSTQAKGFMSVLRADANDFVLNAKQWCLVFDHHDLDQVLPDLKGLVETLVRDVINKKLPNVRVILLGHGDWKTLPADVNADIIEVQTVEIQPTDVERFLTDIAANKQEPLTPVELDTRKLEVLNNLALPLNLDGMRTMCNRLKKYC